MTAVTEPAIRFAVYGTPGPQGSKSPKGRNRRTGRLIMVESSKKVKPWREAVEAAALTALNDLPREERRMFPLDGPLAARFVFTLAKPTSAPKRTRTWPIRYPDASKLLRSTEDALTKAGVWVDDARLVELDRLAKVFPGEDPEALDAPGVLIVIRRISEVPAVAPIDSHCHVVRDGDTIPCPNRPGEPHVDEDGREWGWLRDFTDEEVSGCG